MMKEHQLGMQPSLNSSKFQQEQDKDLLNRTIHGMSDLKGQQNLLGQPSSKREPEFSKWQWVKYLPV
ncbi:hypothetical protein SLEP1_g14383 [Rubroshorea leprosula]|uniref:Uncharacterized protein n=1 Tax=Rubroshorea leprosula TaxID=152421 RepID=A0AAV5IUF7_9ROSI|nr:hypothetical protein SLEP1_g14383 [Rubroshorea leprosula]